MSERPISEEIHVKTANDAVREALEEIAQLPGARAAVLIAEVDPTAPSVSRLIVEQKHPGYEDTMTVAGKGDTTKDVVPITSIGKLPWVVTAASWAERAGIGLSDPIELDADQRKGLEKELGYVLGLLDIRLKPELSLRALIEMTLAVSTNTSILAIKDWLTKSSGQSAPDFVQADVGRIFKDMPGYDEPAWTVTGSAKAGHNGISNGATLWEVLAYFQLIANGDARLGLSPETVHLMHQAMGYATEPMLELKARLWYGPSAVVDIFGKFGHDPHVAHHEVPTLFARQGLGDDEWLAAMGSVERVSLHNGRILDICHYLTVPHKHPPGLEHELEYERWREGFGNAIPGRIADWLVESASL